MARLLTSAAVAALLVASGEGRTLLAPTAPAPAAAPTTPTPPTPLNSVYTFVAASATLDRTGKTLTLSRLGAAVTGSVSSGGESMPLRHSLADVFGPATFLPIFAGPGPIQALLDGDAPAPAPAPAAAPAAAAKARPARVALTLTPGTAVYDAAAGTLTLGVTSEGPVVEEAAKKGGGVVGAALAHTAPEMKAAGAGAGGPVTLSSAALSIDVGVPQAAAALTRARERAAGPASAAKPATVAAASVP